MVKRSVVMTVFNRDVGMLSAVFHYLYRVWEQDCELIVVNDGSTRDYSGIKAPLMRMFPMSTWIDMPAYEAFRINDGFNNPAKAFNTGLQAAEGDEIVIMSSDILVTRDGWAASRKNDPEKTVWTPMIIDTDTSFQYCGPMRLFPAPWFLCMSREKAVSCGGWDETYLQGTCFEDNDFMGRICLATGAFDGDWRVAMLHLSHDQIYGAIQEQNPDGTHKYPELYEAWEKSYNYTRKKWNGIPFDQEMTPFDVKKKPWPDGRIINVCKAKDGLLDSVVEKTVSPFVEVIKNDT